MAWISAKLDRLRFIVAECIKRGRTPRHVGFADLVIQIANGQFGLSRQVAKDYVRILINAWNYNKWLSYIKHNDYLTLDDLKPFAEKHLQIKNETAIENLLKGKQPEQKHEINWKRADEKWK